MRYSKVEEILKSTQDLLSLSGFVDDVFEAAEGALNGDEDCLKDLTRLKEEWVSDD